MVGVIKMIFTKYLDGLEQDELWREFLPQVLFFLRFTAARATGMTPFEAVYGFEPTVPSLVLSDRLAEYQIDYAKLD